MHSTLIELMAARSGIDTRVTVIRTTTDREQVSFAELMERAARRLGVLRRHGFEVNDYCLFYLYDEMAFLELFWACIMGGIVPVPVAPGNTPDHKDKLLTIAAQIPTARIIADASADERLCKHLTATAQDAELLRDRTIIYTDLTGLEDLALPVERSRNDVAFIQFSSGSTRMPKGVVLTHGNLLENLQDISFSFGMSGAAVSLSWMPLTHDMGLIGFHLGPLFGGIDHHIMRTSLFTRRPLVWLELAAELGATTLSCPNFGYRHWLKAYKKSAPVLPDLSAVKFIINGAEPISVPLTREFLETLSPAGLSKEAMCCGYGLAEASLVVTVESPGQGLRFVSAEREGLTFGAPVKLTDASDSDGILFARNGKSVAKCNIRIATKGGVDLGCGVLGEVQINGQNVTAGYLNQDDANAELFTTDGWLRTGDLGFLHADELVVTGRLKDMIVHQGQNYFAPDIEMLVEQKELASTGEVAAGATAVGDSEGFVLFVRSSVIGPEFAKQSTSIRKLVFESTGLNLVDVVPVRSISKTTSGKIRRSAMIIQYVAGDYEDNLRLISPQARGANLSKLSTTNVILKKLEALMSTEAIDTSGLNAGSNFFEIGVTSLLLAELTDDLNEAYADVVEVTDFFEHTSVKDIANEIDRRLQTAPTT